MSLTPKISLSGAWNYALDPLDLGINEAWFRRPLPETIQLPGTLSQYGIGDPITVETEWIGQVIDKSWYTEPEFEPYRQPGNVKVPFWLQPETYYMGAAWYQRSIMVPRDWAGKRVVLSLERCHWKSDLWLNDFHMGDSLSLSTPHEYDLGPLAPGEYQITVRVDNRLIIDIGVDSHAVSEHTQGNWNGLVGDLSLRAEAPVWISNVQVYPRLADWSIRVIGEIGNATATAGNGAIEVDIEGEITLVPVHWTAEGGVFETEISLSTTIGHWDEFTPNVYRLRAVLNGESEFDTCFGMREIATEGNQVLINGRPTFFRGTLECCIFPKTGHPPTERAEWDRIFGVAKSFGLNHIRFHSYCPPRVAFEAADAIGLYLQIETCWANASTRVGEGRPVDEWIYEETDRILREYGNHPSFVLMPYGNEPGGDNQNAYLTDYVYHYRTVDSRRLWTSGAGWPEIEANQFHITPTPRIHQWGEELRSRINGQPPATTYDYRDFISERSVPVISHEIGQWCVYPNLAEIDKYTGYLKARNFEIFRDSLAANGMLDQAPDFLYASGRLQTLCYKEEIESSLRTPGMAGFQLLDLHDFPGQGTALVGVLDPFWDEKGYVTAAEYRRFCGPITPLARLAKRVYSSDERLVADIEIVQFGAGELSDVTISWQLASSEAVFAEDRWVEPSLPVGNGRLLRTLEIPLSNVSSPTAAKLVISVENDGKVVGENDWDVWIYPRALATTPMPICTDPDEALLKLEAGETVVLQLNANQLANDEKRPVKFGFSSIFWNTAWTSRQAPTTLGLLLDPTHPLFRTFPTERSTNWQWWYLTHHAAPILMNALPPELRPTVQIIDDWTTNHRLGLLFEAKVGEGKLLVTSLDLLGNDPVSRQFAHSVSGYLASDMFAPSVELKPQDLARILRN